MKKRFINTLLALCMAFTLYAGTVNLNFFVGSDKIHAASVTEGGTYTLSEVISAAGINMVSYQCRDYVFRGWKVGSPVEGTETPIMPTAVTPADNMNLYAVFEHTDDSKINNFIRITNTDNLEANAEYLIICYYVYGRSIIKYFKNSICSKRINMVLQKNIQVLGFQAWAIPDYEACFTYMCIM